MKTREDCADCFSGVIEIRARVIDFHSAAEIQSKALTYFTPSDILHYSLSSAISASLIL